MADYAVSKETGYPVFSPVKELVYNNNVARLNILPHAAHGRYGYYPFNTQFLHAVDICPVVQLRRQESVPPSVPWQKDHFYIPEFANNICIRRITKRSFYLNLFNALQTFHLVKPATSDNSNNSF